MRPAGTTTSFKAYLLPLLFIVLIVHLAGCGEDQQAANEPSDTGSITFSAVWPGMQDDSSSDYAPRALTGNVCDDYLIDTITAIVYYTNDVEITRANFSCEAHGGTIPGVPVGSVYVVLLGKMNDEVKWEGQSITITVQANTVNNIDQPIVMKPPDDAETDAPSVIEATPSEYAYNPNYFNDGDTLPDVPLNTTITVKFSELMIPNLFDAETVTVKDWNGETVEGDISYDTN